MPHRDDGASIRSSRQIVKKIFSQEFPKKILADSKVLRKLGREGRSSLFRDFGMATVVGFVGDPKDSGDQVNIKPFQKHTPHPRETLAP